MIQNSWQWTLHLDRWLALCKKNYAYSRESFLFLREDIMRDAEKPTGGKKLLLF